MWNTQQESFSFRRNIMIPIHISMDKYTILPYNYYPECRNTLHVLSKWQILEKQQKCFVNVHALILFLFKIEILKNKNGYDYMEKNDV